MKTIFYVQYFRGGKWNKTYFGRECDEDDLHYFNSFEEAKTEIEDMHKYQKANKKKLTKYRILERIYTNKEILQLP